MSLAITSLAIVLAIIGVLVPGTNTYYVASGFGEKSDWFRNIQKTPKVNVRVPSRP